MLATLRGGVSGGCDYHASLERGRRRDLHPAWVAAASATSPAARGWRCILRYSRRRSVLRLLAGSVGTLARRFGVTP